VEKELTEQEELRQLGKYYAERGKAIRAQWTGKHMPGRDGGFGQEYKILDEEYKQRYFEIKKKYANKHSE
jgi:hypothetical protein